MLQDSGTLFNELVNLNLALPLKETRLITTDLLLGSLELIQVPKHKPPITTQVNIVNLRSRRKRNVNNRSIE